MENPIFTLKGKTGVLTVFNNRIVITRKGFLNFLAHGMSGEKGIPLSAIQSVQLKKGSFVANGYIQFGILGGLEKRGGVMNAVDDENSVVFTKSNNDLALKIKEYIEEQIYSRQNATQTTIINQSSAADEVIKLKQLLDNGIITSDEFEKKKKELLGL